MAPAPTKTPSQAASNAATARSQRRSVRATSWRRGPPPPVGTGARIAEGAGLGPGALTLAPGGRYRPLRGALLDERDHDPRLVLRAGRRGVRGRGRARDRSLAPQARGLRRAARRAGCLLVLPGPAGALSWEEAAGRARPLVEVLLGDAEQARVRLALEPVSQLRVDLGFLHSFDEALDFAEAFGSPWLGVVLELNNAWVERRLYANIRARTARIAIVQVSDFKVGTMCASERVVIGDGDIPLRRLCGALAEAGYDGWYDIELLGPAIEAEGYEAVVPRAIARFRGLWT